MLSSRTSPQLLSGLMNSWRCCENRSWEIPRLRERFGKFLFSCGMNPDNNGDPVLMRLGDFVDTHLNHTAVSTLRLFQLPYIFDPSFDFDCPDLLQDYEVPLLFAQMDSSNSLSDEFKPDYRWLLIGGLGSGSSLHIDPCFTSAWNATVVGKKLWVLVHPDVINSMGDVKAGIDSFQQRIHNTLAELGVDNGILRTGDFEHMSVVDDVHYQLSKYLLTFSKHNSLNSSARSSKLIVVIQHAGQILYVPAGWYHAVLNITPTVAITHNFVEHFFVDQFFHSYQLEARFKFNESEWRAIRSCLFSAQS